MWDINLESAACPADHNALFSLRRLKTQAFCFPFKLSPFGTVQHEILHSNLCMPRTMHLVCTMVFHGVEPMQICVFMCGNINCCLFHDTQTGTHTHHNSAGALPQSCLMHAVTDVRSFVSHFSHLAGLCYFHVYSRDKKRDVMLLCKWEKKPTKEQKQNKLNPKEVTRLRGPSVRT